MAVNSILAMAIIAFSNYPFTARHTFQCKKCRHQVSLTAGTVMASTHMPLRKWFWAIYLVAVLKNSGRSKQRMV
jgi:transposase-like protein